MKQRSRLKETEEGKVADKESLRASEGFDEVSRDQADAWSLLWSQQSVTLCVSVFAGG